MKPEVSERLFIEELFKKSKSSMDEDISIENIDRLTGDASTRRYYRVYTNKVSFVVCLDNPSDEDNSFVKVQKFLESKSVSVPKIYDKDLSKGYLLEEDLGDITLLSLLSNCNIEQEYTLYKSAIDELISIHQLNKDEVDNSNIFHESFDYEKLKFEINFTIKYFIKFYLGCEDQHILDKLSDLFGPLCVRLSSEKMVLTHRDYHSRNIMMLDKKMKIIDFQDARWGIPQYDLASLLDDCYYDLDPVNRVKLKQYYFDKVSNFIEQDFDKFNDLYIDMAIQRVFKAVGSFCYIYHNRKDERYLKYIGFALEKLRKYFLTNEKYNEIRKIIFGLYYES
ncbi:MAG: phosphotransferase [Bacteriovoracaceae bacterium]|jgi:aminoglycoside/choline kinase family phosphotransferase|nr:phosphotransferase [Bacteriovoracaceae bacterium]